MNLSSVISKYAGFAEIAFRQGLAEKGSTIGRFGFYGIILLVFSRVWTVAHEHPLVAETNPVDMLWYLATTEWIILSIPLVHVEIEQDVRSGNLAYLLCRPISYVWMRLLEGFGALLLRLTVLGIAGVVFARLLAGGFPTQPAGLLLAAPLGILAGFVGMVFYAAIGLSAFWLQDANPLYWVWSKLSFILGGLILPLSLYPQWLQNIAHMTPFSTLLYGPAHSAVTFDLGFAARTVLLLVLWGCVALMLMQWLYRHGQRVVNINGG